MSYIQKKLHLRFQVYPHHSLKHFFVFYVYFITVIFVQWQNSFPIWINWWWCVYGSTRNVQIVSIYPIINLIGTLLSFLRRIIDLLHTSSTRVPFRRYAGGIIFKSKARTVHSSRELLWFISRFINTLQNVFFFIFSTHNAAGRA